MFLCVRECVYVSALVDIHCECLCASPYASVSTVHAGRELRESVYDCLCEISGEAPYLM